MKFQVSENMFVVEIYERLGWRPSMPDTKDIVFYQAGGIAFALFP